MSAITGSGESRTICFSASASSILGTAQRTTSQPAEASAAIWAVVAETSRVGVSVIDWTTTGAPPPICTLPTLTLRSLAISAECSRDSAAVSPATNVSTGRFRRMPGKARHPDNGTASGALAAVSPATNVSTGHFRRMPGKARHPDNGTASGALVAVSPATNVSTGHFRRMPGKARHPDNGTASGALAAGPAADVVGQADEEEG